MKNRIKELREEKRMSQLNLSTKLNVAQETISAYELGKHYPNVSVLIKMSKIFHASTDYILGLSDIRNPKQEKYATPEEGTLLELFSKMNETQRQKTIAYMHGILDK